MKKSEIALIIVAGIAIAAMVAALGGSGQAETFAVAYANPGVDYKINGWLVREEPIIYNPEENAELTVFTMRDSEGKTSKVYLNEAKQQGFEQSESINLFGYVEDGKFKGHDMQMKCPSKYNDQKHMIDQQASAN
ncbi:MAG: hypothetical protein AB8B53_02940 [Flavobacteriales bacterium]